jgi:hypothetical protein
MNKTRRSAIWVTLIVAMLVLSATAVLQAQAGIAVPNWDVTGTYQIDVIYLGVHYPETLVLTQTGSSITGSYLDTIPATNHGGSSYFTVIGGYVSGSDIVINCQQTNRLTVQLVGTIGINGYMSGTWSDTVGGSRSGTWTTTAIIQGMFQLPESPFGTAAVLLSAFVALTAFAGIKYHRNKIPLIATH